MVLRGGMGRPRGPCAHQLAGGTSWARAAHRGRGPKTAEGLARTSAPLPGARWRHPHGDDDQHHLEYVDHRNHPPSEEGGVGGVGGGRTGVEVRVTDAAVPARDRAL